MKIGLQTSVLPEICQGEWLQISSEVTIQQIIIDSRKNCIPETTLFIALQGKRVSGLQFVDALYQKGVRTFIVDQKIDLKNFPEASVFLVTNSIEALQKIARWHRKKFSYPVIGITGSNGKTIVKEWLYHLLKKHFNIIRSPKSYNSQIGVPLSVLEMTEEHTLAIFEAGISQPGEMQFLADIIQPNYGIFTHLGTSHLENFEDQFHLFKEKCLLFKNTKVNVAPKNIIENDEFTTIINRYFTEFSAEIKEDIKTKLFVKSKEKEVEFGLPFSDQASVQNLISCISMVAILKVDLSKIVDEVASLEMPALRLEILEGKNQCQIINDAYNNDLSGLEIALDFQKRQKGYEKYVLILSSMEGADHDSNFLQKISSLIATADYLNMVVLIGPDISKLSEIIHVDNIIYFTDTLSFIKEKVVFNNASILIKGSRRFQLEKIAYQYSQVSHETVLNINLDAIRENLDFFRSKIQPDTKIMIMVKAAAYGSGLEKMALWLNDQKVDALGVAYVNEGIAIREAGIDLPIMVLNAAPKDFSQLIDYRLEPAIGSLSRLESFIRSLISENIQNYPIHIEMETGMHRLGIEKKDWNETISLLKAQPEVQVASVFSHFAASDYPTERTFTLQQVDRFKEAVYRIEEALPYRFIKHICNSQGILHYPEAHFDMVRIGLGLYGYGDSHLTPAFSMTSSISQIKTVEKGEGISYGRTFIAEKDTKIGIIPIGYADGLNKALSNGQWSFLLKNTPVPILGQICMDMCMVDLTQVSNVYEGDSIQIFGPGNELKTMAKKLNTITYEVLTGISGRIMRIYEE